MGKYDIPAVSIPVYHKAPVTDGFGVLFLHNEEIYRGLWKNGLFDGRGKLKGYGWTYDGELRSGHFEGMGNITFDKGIKWTGVFSRSVPEGDGCFTCNGNSITGTWRKGTFVKNTTDCLL